MKRITKWLSVSAGGLVAVGLIAFVGSYLGFAGQFLVPLTLENRTSERLAA